MIKLRKVQQPSNFPSTNIVDSLTSSSPTDALSANQGRTLKEIIEALKNVDSMHATWLYDNGSNNTAPGVTNVFTLNLNWADFDAIIVRPRGDWDNMQSIIIYPNIDGTVKFNIAIIGTNPTSYAVYGRIWLTGANQISVYCSSAYGWSGISLWRVYGVKFKING